MYWTDRNGNWRRMPTARVGQLTPFVEAALLDPNWRNMSYWVRVLAPAGYNILDMNRRVIGHLPQGATVLVWQESVAAPGFKRIRLPYGAPVDAPREVWMPERERGSGWDVVAPMIRQIRVGQLTPSGSATGARPAEWGPPASTGEGRFAVPGLYAVVLRPTIATVTAPWLAETLRSMGFSEVLALEPPSPGSILRHRDWAGLARIPGPFAPNPSVEFAGVDRIQDVAVAPALAQEFLHAVVSVAPTRANVPTFVSLASRLYQAGAPEFAQALLRRSCEALNPATLPGPAPPPPTTSLPQVPLQLDPNMDPAFESIVVDALANEQDPGALQSWSNNASARGYPIAARHLSDRAAYLVSIGYNDTR